MTTIDDNAGYVGHRHPTTSQQMQQRMMPRSGTLRRQLFDLIATHGGLSDYELEQHTGRSHQSVSASRNTLMNDGFIEDSGWRRLNGFGNACIVWQVSRAR